ncbi:hypothetical protein I79_024424 [Cricetulus griseus]|uniref:Uncharacterized protein n=1 Tax=Cricetulus griseus TaxID=10029 RepID=G3IKM1_CRIGR|nr:hypothetical protein I79_024424 [Cricetulus griseus]
MAQNALCGKTLKFIFISSSPYTINIDLTPLKPEFLTLLEPDPLKLVLLVYWAN